jgi:hypothetical protein
MMMAVLVIVPRVRNLNLPVDRILSLVPGLRPTSRTPLRRLQTRI